MRSRSVLLSLGALLGCLPEPPPTLPRAVLRSAVLESPDSFGDSTLRAPVLQLRFDRPLAPPIGDAVWVLRGALGSSVLTEAARGTPAALLRQPFVAHDVELSEDARTLLVRVREALQPEEEFTAVLTARLATDQGGSVTGATGAASTALRYRVAPARRCATLLRWADATPAFPGLRRAMLAADRPLPAEQWRRARVTRAAALEGLEVLPSCGSEEQSFRCALVTFREAVSEGPALLLEAEGVVDAWGGPVQVPAPERAVGATAPGEAPSFAAPTCAPQETPVESFCALAGARELRLRASTTSPALLSLQWQEQRVLSALGLEHRLLLGAPRALVGSVLVELLSAADGEPRRSTFEAPLLGAALPQLRITEVLARPSSGSAQEFLEVLNEGSSTAQTDGLFLYGETGRSALPAGSLEAGQRAVLAGPSFDPRGVPSRGDPPLASGALLLRSTGSLAGHGLSDQGQDLYLGDRDGRALSRAPLRSAGLAPRAGVSVVRADDRYEADDPAGWSYDAQGRSTPGGPDALR